MQEGRYKVRLPISDLVEKQWEDNLSDMRVIVAKEYFNFLHGIFMHTLNYFFMYYIIIMGVTYCFRKF